MKKTLNKEISKDQLEMVTGGTEQYFPPSVDTLIDCELPIDENAEEPAPAPTPTPAPETVRTPNFERYVIRPGRKLPGGRVKLPH